MNAFLLKANQWLNKNMFFVVLMAIMLGFNVALENSPFLSALATGLFAYMTFISALQTTFKDFLIF